MGIAGSFSGVKLKRPGREADHSPSSSAEVKNGGAIPPLPICLHGIAVSYFSTGTPYLTVKVNLSLWLIKNDVMKTYGKMKAQLHHSYSWHGSEWAASRPMPLYLGITDAGTNL
jgi:hypothetical protein